VADLGSAGILNWWPMFGPIHAVRMPQFAEQLAYGGDFHVPGNRTNLQVLYRYPENVWTQGLSC
jgi:hypothetical protein